MAKIGRNATSGRFVTVSKATAKPRTTILESVSIRDKESGRELPLQGYGVMKGRFKVKAGLDLSKPIAAQSKSSPARKK